MGLGTTAPSSDTPKSIGGSGPLKVSTPKGFALRARVEGSFSGYMKV